LQSNLNSGLSWRKLGDGDYMKFFYKIYLHIKKENKKVLKTQNKTKRGVRRQNIIEIMDFLSSLLGTT
jgi:hypothetical protein